MKFEEILVIATTLMGVIYLLDVLFFKAKRVACGDTEVKEPIIVEYSRSFFPVLLLVLILRSFLAEPFKIPSASMKPTLIEGDHIMVNKFNYGIRVPILGYTLIKISLPKRGDVIVFRHASGKDMIKRVVGLPGDHVLYKDKVLYINNRPVELSDGQSIEDGFNSAFQQTEKIYTKKHKILTNPFSLDRIIPYNDIIVPQDSYFVMGDNRDNSQDSRYWGFVEDRQIIGRAFGVWWSWHWQDLFHVKIYWNRIFKAIE